MQLIARASTLNALNATILTAMNVMTSLFSMPIKRLATLAKNYMGLFVLTVINSCAKNVIGLTNMISQRRNA